jgi:hypothetical protein
MSEPSEQAKKLPSMMIAPKIDIWYRIGSIVIGLVGLGSGGAAVFLTRVEAGPVALIVAGSLFLLIGASGRLPNRLKIGDNEAEWYEVFRRVQETAEATAEATATKAVRSELDLAMQRLQQIAPEYAASIPSMAFLFHAVDAVKEAAAKLESVQYELCEVAEKKYPILSGANGKRAHFVVIVDINTAGTDTFIVECITSTLPLLAEVGVDRLLFITKEELPRALRAVVLNNPLIETVIINYEDGVPRLMEAIASLLEIPRREPLPRVRKRPHRNPSGLKTNRPRTLR